jgi:hypothetical protein
MSAQSPAPYPGLRASNPVEQFETGHFRHLEIQEHDIGRLAQQLRLASAPVLASRTDATRRQLTNQAARHLLVIDQKHPGFTARY